MGLAVHLLTYVLIILRLYTTPIVLHFDRIESIVLESHFYLEIYLVIFSRMRRTINLIRTDRGSSGVQAVFHQFLYHRTKVYDDLSRLYLMNLALDICQSHDLRRI